VFEFLTILIACTLSILIAVGLLEVFRSRYKQNLLPDGAYKIRDVGNGWKSFSLRINFKEHSFLSNGKVITEIEQD